MVVNEKLLQQRHVIPYHGRQIELCGGFYDGHKPVVEPLARPVFMLTDHTQTHQAE